MNHIKRLWFLLIIGTLLICVFLWSPLTPNQYNRKVTSLAPNRTFVSPSLKIRSDNKTQPITQPSPTDDEVRYHKLLESYHKTLAAIPRNKYTRDKDSIIKGPPLSSILKETVIDGNQSVKRILAWTAFFGNKSWIPKTICEGEKQSCVSLTNRKEMANVDGIVVHARDLNGTRNLPSKLLPHQRLIYLIKESPLATFFKTGDYNGVYNWTATYRVDSDSPFTYFSPSIKRNPLTAEEFTKILDEILTSKTKLVTYMGSNWWSTHTERLNFIRIVKKHIPVDMYGAVGNLKCSRDTKECSHIMSQYKFYLSLENANCREYITEKVLNPLIEWRAVPIVMGGADPSDYERILPPNSYIHSAGFPNVSELAEFLQILDRNPHLYAGYHKWRKTHQEGNNDYWCFMCRQLHNTSLPIQYYKNFKAWYEEDVCIDNLFN